MGFWFGVRGVGTVAPRAGGQCAATKTPRKDNAQGRFREGLRLVLRSPPCGLGTCRFCNARVKKNFLNNWKNLNSVPIHHSDFNSGKWQEQGSFFFWGGGGAGTPLRPLRTHTRLTYFSSITFSPPIFHLSIFCPYQPNFLSFRVGSFVSSYHVLFQPFSNLMLSNSNFRNQHFLITIMALLFSPSSVPLSRIAVLLYLFFHGHCFFCFWRSGNP